jgi:hypothetical protein
MSLHKFAEQVASQGRGDDSLLVHMTPDEVRNLQQFAQANGTTLTINPVTGLPEAGLLSDLFKSIAPIALGAFLGPAGLGMSSMMAGVATGGITTLATGSLSRGLMAGLGAYGGAGLGDSLMTAGGGMSAANAATTAQQQLSGANLALGEAMPAQAAEQFTKDAVARMTPSGAVSAGFNKAIASPTAAMDFAKNNLTNIGMAAAPIMAGAMVPTTTKLGDPKDTGYIRQMAYNINPATGRPDPLYGRVEMAPVKASEWKDKTFQGQRDLFYQQNQNPYELGVGSLNQPPQQQPTPMATGGIVALAAGGYKPTDTEIFDYFKKPGLDDAQIAADMQKFGVSAADIARATGTQGQQADYEKRFVNTLNAPGTDASEFLKATGAVGLKDQSLATAMQNAGLSQGAQYALTQPALSDAGFTGGIIDSGTGKAVDLYNQIGYTAGALPGDQGGLEGLYGNINYVSSGLQNLIDTGKMSVADAQNAALAELARTGVSVADVNKATGKDFGNLFTPKKVDDKKVVVDTATSVVPGGTQLPGATVYNNGAFGNYGSGPTTGVDYKGNTVSIATPGDIITNTDGTRTVVPNIPGRPYGGFTGMEGVKSAYTAGGGSLGYTAPVPKTAAEHNAMYNKLTDDSLDAYNFLMGKGKNLTQRKAETRDRPVMQRYDEAVLGRKMVKPVATTTTTKKVVGVPGNPQSYFNEAEYLAANPDVAAELKTGKSVSGQPTRYSSGYEHYLMYGKTGGRAFTGDYEGYLTAAALANAANAGGGGDGPTGPSGGNNSNSISGFNPAPPNDSIPDVSMSPVSTAAPPAAPPSGDDGDGGDGDDAVGGYYSRGKLNYRTKNMAMGGYAMGGGLGSLGSYSDGGRLLKGPGDGVSDSIPATIGQKQQPARLADGEFVIPARIVSELGNGSTDAGAKKLYAMMDRVQKARGKTTGKNKVAANSRADKYLPA